MAANFKRTRSQTDTTATAGGGDRAPRIDQIVELFKPRGDKFYTIRFVGPIFSYGAHWFEINKKDGGTASISKECLAWDDTTESVDSDRLCPYCKLDEKGRPTVHYYQNIIIRDEVENAPAKMRRTASEKESGFKEKDSESWTPVRVMRLPPGAVVALRDMAELNKHGQKGSKKPYAVDHEKYGCDIIYKYKPKEAGNAKHNFQKGDPSPITEEEDEYLLWNIEDMVKPDDLKVAKDEANRLRSRLVNEPDEEEEEEEGEYPKKKKPSFEEDDDEPPKKKRKPVEEEEEEEEEEDAPPKKKKKPVEEEEEEDAPPKKKRKPVDEDDEDESPKKKRKPVDDEDEEEDEPPKKKKKPSFDDDDDDIQF